MLRFTWKTADEVNVLEYTVEQSTDGRVFSAAAQVPAWGSGDHKYATNISALSGTVYYTLKMEDKDASVRYSEILSVKNNCTNKNNVKIYPNPAKESIILKGTKT